MKRFLLMALSAASLVFLCPQPSLAQLQPALLGGSGYVCQFDLIDSSDHRSGKTGFSTWTSFKISKNGGTPGSPTNTPTEVNSSTMKGGYKLALDPADLSAYGPVKWHIDAGSGIDEASGYCADVGAYDPRGSTPSIADLVAGVLNALCADYSSTGSIGKTLCIAAPIPKNVAISDYPIWFKDSSNTGVTGLLAANIHCYVQKDNGSFAETTNTTEVEAGRGKYLLSLSATELNGNKIGIDCTATSGSNTYHYTTSFFTNH